MDGKKSFTTETAKPINVLVPRSKFPKAGAAVSTAARERECVAVYDVWGKLYPSCTGRNDVCCGEKNSRVSKSTTPSLTISAPQEESRAYRKGEGRSVLCFVEYLLLLRGWCASLRPPTICAKSYKAYNVSTCYYRIKQQNGMSLAASPHAIYLPYTLLR
jgi:hypothetical protein